MPKTGNIEDVDLTLDLTGKEGLDLNYISRVRGQFLFQQHNAFMQQSQLADAKAAALMTLVGLIALRGPVDLADAGRTLVATTFGIASALTIVFCMIAVFPRFPRRSVCRELAAQERWSWPSLSSKTIEPVDYSDFMQTSEMSQLVHSTAMANVKVARVLRQKFLCLRIAFLSAVVLLIILGVRLYGFM
ncbi:MAG: Pycsar system effector family protein [Pseudomonadota bacterium]